MLMPLMQAQAQDWNPAVVLEWNTVVQQTPANGPTGPLQSRAYAMVHIAMLDAANSVARRYTPFHTSADASSGASMEAAAAQAAHDVMIGLFGNQPAFHATLTQRMATIAPGRARQGAAIGAAVARDVLAWRLNDGAFGPPSAYSLPAGIAGLWQPFVTGAPTGLTQVPRAMPFAVLSATQFLPQRFPEMNSARYAGDFEEVRLLGRATGSTRTADQTKVAELWANQNRTSTPLFVIWNNLMQDAVKRDGLSLLEAARGFALMNASMFDGLITSMTGKLVYGLWRPWDAIRRAADDANPNTTPDATWTPLLGTPPYPSYPGNMACLGSAAARTLVNVTGKDTVTVSATWKGNSPYPDETRTYPSYSAVAQEEAMSRVYGGIHFRFDNDVSLVQCAMVADWVDSRVRPLH
jgi:hypothetical protein